MVTELEGNLDKLAPENRQQQMREKIKEIIPCNIRADDLLGSQTQFSQFDIIHTNLCLEVACESKDEFSHCVAKLGALLKPGGYLLVLTAKGGAWYTCAGAGSKLFQLKIEEEDIRRAIADSGEICVASIKLLYSSPPCFSVGLTLLDTYNIEPVKNPLSATRSFQFTIAQKTQ